MLGAVLGALMVLDMTVALCWVLCVERKTLAAAIEDVASSVESHWYGRAASAVFADLLLVVGIEARIFGSPRGRAPLNLVLVAVLLAILDFAAHYRSPRRAEG